jgi:glycosyltransferase involved in cell wall biosynthesis
VIALAADPRFGRPVDREELAAVRRRYRLEHPFVLFTGTLEPRKNLTRLVEAWTAMSPAIRGERRLVIVGSRGWEEEPLLTAIERRRDIAVLGFVPDGDLAALYQLCEVFCYPSLYEGFGLPLLEAMQSGAACVTTRGSSLTEVGGEAVRYVDDPRDAGALREALEQLLGDPDERARLGASARQAAARFSWERTADDVLTLLESLALAGRAAAP